jgi:hypothetical protein
MRRIQRDHPDRATAVDDDPRRLRIEPDVELRRRRDVPVVVSATHDHDLRDRLDDARLLLDGHGDIRQRPNRAEHDVAGRVQVGLDQPVDGVPRLERRLRRGRQVEEIAVDSRGHAPVDLRSRDRAVNPPVHGDLGQPDPVEHAEGVLRGVVECRVAVDRRRADELEVRRERRDHERHRVVGSGVDVEDHLGGHDRSLPDSARAF